MSFDSFDSPTFFHHCRLVDENDNPLIIWIAKYTGSCVYGSESEMSFVFGYISLICWLGAQLPQIITNYKNSSVEGLSLGLVFNWFMGDFTNFVGCLLTHQMPFQTLLAFYYVCVDLVLGGQFYYYTRPHRRRFHLHSHKHKQLHKAHQHHHHDIVVNESQSINNNNHPSTQPVNVPSGMIQAPNKSTVTDPDSEGTYFSSSTFNASTPLSNVKALFTSSFIASFSRAAAAPIFSNNADSFSSNENTISTFTINSEFIGTIFAWTCTCCYLTSRLPQIYSNFKRKSTSGTAIMLFLAALVGNVTYTLSILLSPDARGKHGMEFLKNELPFLLGSAGTVMFDVTIFIQWLVYSNDSYESKWGKYEKLQALTADGDTMSDDGLLLRSSNRNEPDDDDALKRSLEGESDNTRLITSDISYAGALRSEQQPLIDTESTPLSSSPQSSYSATL